MEKVAQSGSVTRRFRARRSQTAEEHKAVVSEDNQTKPPARLRPLQPPDVVLAADTQTTGELKSEGNVLVDGVYEGRIEVVGWLIVGQRARVTADILARHVRVDGQVHGDIQAVGQVQVGPTGQVRGAVTAAHVLVDPGGAVYAAGDSPPVQPIPPAPTVGAPSMPPVEIVRSARSPARERLSRAEKQLRWRTWRRWAGVLGVAAIVLLAIWGTLVLSGVLSSAVPSPTPTQLVAGLPQTPEPSPTRSAKPSATATVTAIPRTPTASPPPYPFMPAGPVVSEYPNCAPAVVWLRGRVQEATPEQLQHVKVQVRYPDGRVLSEPVQPDGSYEVRLYPQGPCLVTLIDDREGTLLSPTVPVEYADLCLGSAFTLHWRRVV